jgi:probable rRNA maturation factor
MPDPDRRLPPDRKSGGKKKKTGGVQPLPLSPRAETNLGSNGIRGLSWAPEIGPTVLVDNTGWRRLARDVEALARRAAMAAGGAGTVVLSSDLAVRRLNSDHRAKNKPTNVLTFEAMHSPAGFLGGDIVLALETVLREAAAAGRQPAHHMAHLVVHGALHLRGYDHHQAGDARRMEMAEARILHRLGVPNPWKRRPLVER